MEIMKSSRDISIFLLVAMGLTLVPAPLEAACDMISDPDVDPCDTSLAAAIGDTTSSRDEGHEDDDCCETGCHHCSLPCCSGTAMIPPFAQVLDTTLTSDGRLAATVTDVTWVDPDPLFHPPRA